MRHLSDEVLVQMVQLQQDQAAFGILVRRHQGRLRGYLRRLLHGDGARADELAQEAFLKAYRHLQGFRGEARFSTWLIGIAYHCLVDALRGPQATLPLPVEPRELDEGGDISTTHATECSDQGQSVAHIALTIDLERALSRLNEPQRLAVVHCHYGGLDYAEAAQVLGWTEAKLRVNLRQALAQLRASLGIYAPAHCPSPTP